MPGNVAVQEPGARVVRLEGQDEVAVRGQQGHVASRGVVEVQLHECVPVRCVRLRQDSEVVAVKMDLLVRQSKAIGGKIELGYRMGCRNESSGRCAEREAGACDDEEDPVVFLVVRWHHHPLRIPGDSSVHVLERGVAEIQPQWITA